MKKLIMALALIASTVAVGSVDTYKFTSKMHTYSLTSQKYKSTSFNGTMVVEDGTNITIKATKKDTKEEITLKMVSTNSVVAIVAGKKDKVGASAFELDASNLFLVFSGDGAMKTTKVGCGPCGTTTSCTKIKNLKGSYVGSYECGCGNGQYYDYDFSCTLPDEKTMTRAPVWGTWKAKLKSSVE